MPAPKGKQIDFSKSELLRTLHLTLWAVPALMAVLGFGYTLYENARHAGDPLWPWPTWAGLIVMGVLGPLLSWLVLRWAIMAANAYLKSQEQLTHRAEELSALNKLSLETSRSLNLEKRITTILEHIMEALDANAGMVFIQQEQEKGLRLEAHRGISVEMAQKEAHLSPGHCLCGQAVANRSVLFANDVGDDPRCTSDLCICEGFHSVACAPLEVQGQLVGLVQLASPEIGHFTGDQRDFLAAAAAQVSVSIENARLYDKVRTFNVELEQTVNRRTSELEAAQWALTEKARQLQRLLSQSYRIQEDTQARIAHDMHDGVTQMIIGALYETQAARQALDDDHDRAVESLAHAQQLLTEVENEIRRVIYDLHPPVLDMMGLVIALKRFAHTYSVTFDLDCQVRVTGIAQRLSKAAEIAIYRVIQEALHNVATHARASQVRVRFDFGADSLGVIVEDNGIGFDPEAFLSVPGDHLGLIGMKERAEGLGAQFAIVSTLGKGTQVKLQMLTPDYIEE